MIPVEAYAAATANINDHTIGLETLLNEHRRTSEQFEAAVSRVRDRHAAGAPAGGDLTDVARLAAALDVIERKLIGALRLFRAMQTAGHVNA